MPFLLLLRSFGVECISLYCEPNGEFPHNPEPLAQHLTDISELVKKESADLGLVVDPDVDRLAIVNEDGSMFGEEYTLVAVADYILSKKKEIPLQICHHHALCEILLKSMEEPIIHRR